MKTTLALVALFGLNGPALAEDLLLSAEAFEAIVEGRTFDTYFKFRRYGIVSFHSGRQTSWQGKEKCMKGVWLVDGDLICMRYVGETEPDCWTYEDHGTFLVAWWKGDQNGLPVTMIPAVDVVTCDGFVGM